MKYLIKILSELLVKVIEIESFERAGGEILLGIQDKRNQYC